MDEVTNTTNQATPQNNVENPYATVTPAGSGTASVSAAAATSDVKYAGFWARFLAVLIDGILVGIPVGILTALLGDSGKSLSSPLSFLLSSAYAVYFISQRGQTIGKQALGLRVQNETTGENLDVVSAILREVVGKFISGIVLLLGYLWMLWDPKKQTWHDKIAKSVVVKVK